MNFFFCSEISGTEVILPEEESKHCIRVLRLNKNETIYLVDGKGKLYRAVLQEPDIKKTVVAIVETIPDYGFRTHHLHIAIAPTKSQERFEWFLEKVTEMGIDEITPLICERSERKTINNRRTERILISAMKQSQRAYLPRLNPVRYFKDIFPGRTEKLKIIAHCNHKDLPLLFDKLVPESPVLILIGPEGDFTSQEVEMAVKNGFVEVSLGPFVYRSETAGVMACHEFNVFFRQ
jgi:16S rRNA (uracil1498-N3)-methyltransferase